jgi:hypothetical protein
VSEKNLFLVFSNPTEGQEAEYNEWYDSTHVHEVLDVPGVVAAQRYALAPMDIPEVEGAPSPPPPAHRYLAVYELESDPNEVMAEFLRRLTTGEMTLHEGLDMATVSMSTWRPRGDRLDAPSTDATAAGAR